MSKKELEQGLIEALKPLPEEGEQEVEYWEPVMGEAQRGFFQDKRRYILAHGERGSGKTMMGMHKLVNHCYQYDDALAMIVVIVKTTATGGGVWDDLTNEAVFMEGPLAGKPAGILAMWREGIGLEYTEPYEDGAHNKMIDIRTINGGVSKIMLKSMPVGAHIQDRIKGQHPSYFHFEELTSTYDPHYFTKVIQQLYRRKTVPAHAQQYVATCNPANEGENHWVFKQFFLPAPNETEEEHFKRFGVHHIPMVQNEWIADKEEYIKTVMEDCRYDPTAAERLIRGKWVERMVGNALFEGFWLPDIHIRPSNAPKGHGLVPFREEIMTWGYDGGTVNNASVLLQRSNIEGVWKWRVIDEEVHINKRFNDKRLVKGVMDKMLFWCEKMECIFPFEHISDSQALTHFNPSGSYTYREWAKLSKEFIKSEKYEDLTPIRMKAPKKVAGSVEERVKCIINKLATDQLIVSPRCRMVIQMFNMLRRHKDRQGNEELLKPLKTTAGHIHIFDALSYAIYYYDLLAKGNNVNDTRSKPRPIVTTFNG
jgi:phage terminase large subunit